MRNLLGINKVDKLPEISAQSRTVLLFAIYNIMQEYYVHISPRDMGLWETKPIDKFPSSSPNIVLYTLPAAPQWCCVWVEVICRLCPQPRLAWEDDPCIWLYVEFRWECEVEARSCRIPPVSTLLAIYIRLGSLERWTVKLIQTRGIKVVSYYKSLSNISTTSLGRERVRVREWERCII